MDFQEVSRASSNDVDAPLSLRNRINSRRSSMTGTMARIADFLVQNPKAPLRYSIKELADKAQTSPATVTRFCRQLGYSGYVPFRVSVAADVGRSDSQTSWHTDIGREFQPDDSAEDVLSSLLNSHHRSLVETAEGLNLKAIKVISQHMALARHIDIYGVGGSAVIGDELRARLYRIGLPVHSWSELHAGLTSASLQGPDCVAIGISNTGRTEQTLEMVRAARRSGATTIGISSDPDSTLLADVDFALVSSAHERFLQPDDLSAKHSQLLVIDLLYLLIAQENFSRTTGSLAASARAVAPHRRPPGGETKTGYMARLSANTA